MTIFNQISIAMKEGIDLFKENNSFLFEKKNNLENDNLYLKTENELHLEISKLINLTTNNIESITVIATCCPNSKSLNTYSNLNLN